MHQPLGLILPVTIVQAFGFLKNRQPAHFAPLGPGLSWYLNCFLLSAAWTGESVAATPSAANGMAAKRLSTRPRETDESFMMVTHASRVQGPPRGMLGAGVETRAVTLTRTDARDRIAVPFWDGILSALGATAIGLAVLMLGALVLGIGLTLATGHAPKFAPGGLALTAMGVVFYAAMAPFAWQRLRRHVAHPFRPLAARDVRALLLGVLALIAVRIGTVVQLELTHQAKHVQAGFEHFSVQTSRPALTALDVGLNVLVLVVVGPLVEELVFRGLLFGALAPRIGVLLGALVSALLFGLAHGDPVLFPSLAALGFVNALLYARTANLTAAVVLHGLSNALGAAFLIAASLKSG
jgi:membrane protease YdiL (CAAX protease family)